MATAAVVTLAATAAVVAPASADHPSPEGEECRHWAPHPHPYVKVVAEDNQFDARCLMAPPNRRFRIYLQNRDTDAHNISIYSADPDKDEEAEQLFKGKAVGDRGQEDYAIDALPPGEYFFRDDNVKGMNGELKVPEKDEPEPL